MKREPRLRVVILNHNGGALLERAVASAFACHWPGSRQVVVIDNASADRSIETVAERFADATIVRRSTNSGFGANNDGLQGLDDVEAILLLNPDAEVHVDAVTALYAELSSAPDIGAASPRLVFDQRFVEFAVTAPERPVRLERVVAQGQDITAQCHGVGGAWRMPRQDGTAWWYLPDHAIFRVPVGDDPVTATFSATAPTTAHIGDDPVSVDNDGIQLEMQRNDQGIEVVQNAGSFVSADGTGHNRGFLEPVSPRHADPCDTPAWCGAAVLLAPAFLRDVGPFAPEFFLYYEDTDLAWRGRSRGWRYRYVDEAVVHHRHSATTGQGSTQTDVLQQRNRLVLLVRNANAAQLVASCATTVAVTARMGVRAKLGQRNGGDGDPTLARRRARGIFAVGSKSAWARYSRRALRRRRRVPASLSGQR